VRFRLLILIALAALLGAWSQPCAQAQTTKVRGRVLDASDDSPIAFAAVFFVDAYGKPTTVGTSTDLDGYFTLSTRDGSLTLLRASILGYNPGETDINKGIYNEVTIHMIPLENRLDAVTVKADNHRARKLLADIDAARDRNNPEKQRYYSCDVYSRIEGDLTHPREQLQSKAIRKQWGFIFDYVDTSEVSGVPYLPVVINETVSRRVHFGDPVNDSETVIANKLSGADQTGNLVSQFTGSMHLKDNFYEQFINAFNIEIPSPANSNGLLFYNYYIVDSLDINGRQTYRVRYHPKQGISTPAFDGEMLVDTGDWALRSVKARLVRGQNVNWLRDMVYEMDFDRRDDSTWFYKSSNLYGDLSIFLGDSTKTISVIGRRALEFSNPSFVQDSLSRDSRSKSVVAVTEDASAKDDAYWAQMRPYPLSKREEDTYNMVDRIQGTKLYTSLYDVVYMIINGYYETNKVEFGPYLKIFSFNQLEGFRLRVGMRTNHSWSATDRLTVYAAYGFGDKQPKGGVSWEHLFSKDPTSKLTLDAHYDVFQMGRGTYRFTEGNILASIMGGSNTSKLCPVTEGSALFEYEFSPRLNFAGSIMYREYHGNSFIPLTVPTIPTAEARATFRLSRQETVIRGYFIKTYTHTDYPVLTFDLGAGAAWMSSEMRPYVRPEISFDWKTRIPPLGMTKLHLNVGTLFGRVPYPLLHIHEGNGTFIIDKTAFSTMNYMEFGSDTWATLLWDHNFYGFFLGKIPLLKKLQLREAFIFKATWGLLRNENDGTYGADGNALIPFPMGMRALGKVPYIETGFGITNILRLFRVDFVWRVTHRNDVDAKINPPRNFVVNLGVELRF